MLDTIKKENQNNQKVLLTNVEEKLISFYQNFVDPSPLNEIMINNLVQMVRYVITNRSVSVDLTEVIDDLDPIETLAILDTLLFAAIQENDFFLEGERLHEYLTDDVLFKFDLPCNYREMPEYNNAMQTLLGGDRNG